MVSLSFQLFQQKGLWVAYMVKALGCKSKDPGFQSHLQQRFIIISLSAVRSFLVNIPSKPYICIPYCSSGTPLD